MDGPGLPQRTIRLSTSGLSDQEGFDYWHSIAGDTYRFHGVRRGERRFQFASTMRTVGDVVLSDFVATPSTKSRNASAIRRDGQPYLKVRQYVSGDGGTVVHAGRSFRLRRGDIHLIDQSREITELSRGDHQYNMFVAHEEIGFAKSRHDACETLMRSTPGGRLLDTAFRDLLPRIASADQDEVARKTRHLVALLRIVLEGGADSGAESAVAAARVRAARRLVADNLSDPTLDPSHVVRLLGVSRATLYRDFAEEGGLERYIYRTRLERGFERLARSRPERGLVERVAEAVGFGSIHHFSNAFRDHFGLRPSDVCGILAGEVATLPGTDDAQPSDTGPDGRLFFDIARGLAS